MGAFTKNLARDLIALGSLPFFILVIARITILKNPEYLSQLFIAGFLFAILTFLFKSNSYAGLSLIIGTFLSIYYEDLQFTIFALAAYILLIASLIYRQETKKRTALGVLAGAIATVASYVLTSYIFK